MTCQRLRSFEGRIRRFAATSDGNDTYGNLYQKFVGGGLGADTDLLKSQPPWNTVLGADLIKSELTLQWKMVVFLESRGVRSSSVDSVKQTLFSEQLAFEAGNRSERIFQQLQRQRLSILRLNSLR